MTRLRPLITIAALCALTACAKNDAAMPEMADGLQASEAAASKAASAEALNPDNKARLKSVLASQPDSVKARYPDRHPDKTLAFFEIQPGMKTGEVLPGSGWYSKILLPYLGSEGELVGIDYNFDMWPRFGSFASDEFLQKRKNWAKTWSEEAAGWRGEGGAPVTAFAFGQRPAELKNTLDQVIFIRAFHHLTRFDLSYLDQALADTKYVLKPGGAVGIVQHRAGEGMADDWANGDNGYLKQSYVIKLMEARGFELTDKSEINANAKDKPKADENVWRLPPTLGTSGDDPELKAKMQAIGESDRMTLKFRLKD